MTAPMGLYALSQDVYHRRHQWLRVVLLAHLLGIALYAAAAGRGPVLVGSLAVALLLAASGLRLRLRAQATAAALGLYGCSALIVNLAHGAIEAHFHFFLVLALISLYQDFVPYVVGIGFVLVEHFVVGVLAPTAVFDHGGSPLRWALIHAGFVAAISIAHVVSWRSIERAGDGERRVLSAEVQRLAAVVDSAGIAIYTYDFDGMVRTWNAAAASLLGYGCDDMVGASVDRLLPASRAAGLVEDLEAVRAGDSRTCETALLAKDGENVEVSLVISPIRAPDDEIVGVSVMVRDVRELKRAERAVAEHQRELTRRAFRDDLTGLANRARFIEHLAGAAQDRNTSVLMLDLDGFKLVNDTAGHATGDHLLQQVARRIKASVRLEDTVARLGGDEFAVLLRHGGNPRHTAERVLAEVNGPYQLNGRTYSVTTSIGVALFDDVGAVDDLLRSADVALYAAKAAGKSCVMVYDAEMSGSIARRTELEADLRTAITQETLQLHYQPVMDIATGAIHSFEALLRWEHPQKGAISPAEIIPIAEETGLIVPLGAWIMRQAAHQATSLSELADQPVTIAVNVSVRQLEQPDFPALVARILADAHLAGHQLILEVTESALARSSTSAVAALNTVRASGVTVAIDDFGTGYSSFDRLCTLPVDQLKIDRSFIKNLDATSQSSLSTSTPKTPVLAAIIAMAKALGLTVVAEGVENLTQLTVLHQLGCNLAQGYLLGRPGPAHDAAKRLLDSQSPMPDEAVLNRVSPLEGCDISVLAGRRD